MTNAIKKLFILSFLLTAATVYAQVAQSVTGGGSAILVGGEYSNFAPDYGSARITGLGASVDFNVTPKIGAIGEARWLHWFNTDDGGETQSDYLAGGKYRVYRFRKFDLNAKFLLGGVWIRFPENIGSGSYFAYAPGAFVDYHLSRKFRIRGSYEYQLLPTAPNIPGYPSNGLTPNGFSAGVEYSIFH
ncbi:MAG: outer membrane beta-barrel protein [Silvibacterium sp.]